MLGVFGDALGVLSVFNVIEVALQCFWDDDEMLETSIGDVIVEAQCFR